MTRVRLWASCLAAAGALHVGAAAAAFVLFAPDPGDFDYGADAIEIALETAAPREDADDLPPGPLSEDSAASAAAAPSETQSPEAPKIVEAISDQAELQSAVETPKKTEPQDAAVKNESVAAIDSPAAEAAAPPASETAVEAPRATAPQIGDSLAAERARATWVRKLLAHLERNKRYPAHVRRAGETKIAFALDARGHVLSARVVASSGTPELDEAALAMMRRADPTPPPPMRAGTETLTFQLPVVFRLQGR